MSWTDKFLNVWIIDDQIPITFLGREGMLISDEALPIRADYLFKLIELPPESWGDESVKNIIVELLQHQKINMTAFVHPTHAIDALKQGMLPPDLILFDWEYTSGADDDHIIWLSELLSKSFTYLIVYSHKSDEEISNITEQLAKELSSQLLGISNKEMTAVELIQKINNSVEGTLAGRVSIQLRGIAEEALGTTLRYFSQISESLLEEILPEDSEDLLANLIEREMISQGIETNDSVIEAISINAGRAASELTRTSDSLIDALSIPSRMVASTAQSENVEAYRRFQSYQIYTKHTTDRILTGDITLLEENAYILVLTPACNLRKFASKTRNTLTYIKLYPCDPSGWPEVASGQKPGALTSGIKIKQSMSDASQIGTEGVFVLASVPYNKDGVSFKDFFILPERIGHQTINQDICEYSIEDALTYSNLRKQYPIAERVARLSDSYLNSMMWAIARSLFSPGTRDYMSFEHNRIKRLANAKFQ